MSAASRGRESRSRRMRCENSFVEKKNFPGGLKGLRSPFRPGCSPILHRVTSNRLETSWRTRVEISSNVILDKGDQIFFAGRGTTRVYPQVPHILQSGHGNIGRKQNLGHRRID